MVVVDPHKVVVVVRRYDLNEAIGKALVGGEVRLPLRSGTKLETNKGGGSKLKELTVISFLAKKSNFDENREVLLSQVQLAPGLLTTVPS